MNAPDVLGLEWEEAELLLEEAGWTASLEETSPPGARVEPEERLRVLRVIEEPNRRVRVLVAPERFLGVDRKAAPPAP